MPWIPYEGKLSPIQKPSNGLLGPGGTVFLTTLPARAHLSQINLGTYQSGSRAFE